MTFVTFEITTHGSGHHSFDRCQWNRTYGEPLPDAAPLRGVQPRRNHVTDECRHTHALGERRLLIGWVACGTWVSAFTPEGVARIGRIDEWDEASPLEVTVGFGAHQLIHDRHGRKRSGIGPPSTLLRSRWWQERSRRRVSVSTQRDHTTSKFHTAMSKEPALARIRRGRIPRCPGKEWAKRSGPGTADKLRRGKGPDGSLPLRRGSRPPNTYLAAVEDRRASPLRTNKVADRTRWDRSCCQGSPARCWDRSGRTGSKSAMTVVLHRLPGLLGC